MGHPLINAYAGLLSRAGVCALMRTLDSQIAYYDPATDPAFPVGQRPRIYIFWHEYILLPFYVRGRCNLSMLLSQHRDADVLDQAARLSGFDVVRGSSRRGGVAALRRLLDRGELQHLAITPDGPRGPRRKMAQGAVYLASKLQMPLVLLGFGFDRPWRVRSWDRFAVPRPGSRARVVVSPEISVPADLQREGQEHYRLRIESLLNRLTCEAEAWASSGQHMPGQYSLLPGPVQPWQMRRFRPARVCPAPAAEDCSQEADAA
ncbi:MAG: lysophospholipid acyltransferase family protein [Planctomycetaceae bacterium]|nr:lysophospholipid acyltransferase family protein [Planctomycetaceae bacterium]